MVTWAHTTGDYLEESLLEFVFVAERAAHLRSPGQLYRKVLDLLPGAQVALLAFFDDKSAIHCDPGQHSPFTVFSVAGAAGVLVIFRDLLVAAIHEVSRSHCEPTRFHRHRMHAVRPLQ